MHRRRRVHLKGLRLPQQQQPERVVELGVGEQHRPQWCGAPGARMQWREGLDLAMDVG